ncbi:hypothetical protein CICLE_v10010882mg [Citrus x clementina]|uniref:Cytochrome c assembly protein domain-containing protein n=1 Tax=Citrus clementina TaxID=85681 RepID=V4RMT4_CITCL|nr:hypothetical protein CICLE_v10018423mg [Citrus x clementina]ESR44577.1 hypothetical protein CICLE_v10030457mg [Citrus x clementina]ESR48766.1 hypothetical protein CICLE_v10010882mg [Citrus x clementina]
MTATAFCLTGLLITRWVYSRHFPLSDLYESLIFLSWSFSIIHKIFDFKNNQNHLSAITAPSAFFTQGFATSGFLTKMHQSRILVPALQVQWSQVIQQLDRWSYRIISLGFIFLTTGILSGAVWANEAWGSYWNWDPKETWAFITWTIFGIYLHTRTNTKWEGVNSAIVASMGFFIIWICYFGVNLLGIGLHSYGSFN